MTTPVVETIGLAKRFGRKWGLRDCTLSIPSGKVAALVGPNGAGKSTLLRMAAGLSRPTSGVIRVLGDVPSGNDAPLLKRVGYLDQERPLYRGFRVEEMFRFGEGTNPTWNMTTAHTYIDQLGISLRDRVNSLSGGQQAQVALTMCLAKQPELLILDEPAAELDPVAREDLLRLLMREVAERGTSVVLSTHALGDVGSICDYLVILSHSKVVLHDDLEFVVESHRLLSASSSSTPALPDGVTVIDTRIGSRDVTHLVRLTLPLVEEAWGITEPTLDEIIMAYLRLGTDSASSQAHVSAPSPRGGIS
ncbi:MAG TPA: ABC transporter ATP-binding protein [Acidimicrobiales bacterium]|nr:ABC transporter ATP-binding protein [Acidimicrobiales bacterium]HUX03830.1 ABC transporter ATP-binding protein [Acidimicrobiales bacterium]